MIEYNKFIEWAEEDRARGECPVQDRTSVTVWFEDGDVRITSMPEAWVWGDGDTNITGYMIHKQEAEPAPCPFCGGNSLRTMSGVGGYKKYSVECLGCGAAGPCGDTEAEANTEWNEGGQQMKR